MIDLVDPARMHVATIRDKGLVVDEDEELKARCRVPSVTSVTYGYTIWTGVILNSTTLSDCGLGHAGLIFSGRTAFFQYCYIL